MPSKQGYVLSNKSFGNSADGKSWINRLEVVTSVCSFHFAFLLCFSGDSGQQS